MRAHSERFASGSLVLTVFVISFAVIAWQLTLMRCLLISRYHHFTFLIVSCALLGFGASGTILSVFAKWFEKHRYSFFCWGTLGFGVSLPICFRVGEFLPLSIYFAPGTLIGTLGWWVLFWIIHVTPFLVAGLFIGLALSNRQGKDSHVIYALSLVGSATGAIGGIFLLTMFAANGIVVPLALCVIASCGPIACRRIIRLRGLYISLLIVSAALLVGTVVVGIERCFPLNIDEYKTLAYAQRLVEQGNAEKTATLHSLRGRIDVFAGPLFHTLLSLNSDVPPPTMDIVLRDGAHVGTIPSIQTISEAHFLEDTLFSIPYRLVRPKKVLILGDAGSVHLWLALLSPAEQIVLVQPDRNVITVLQNHPSRVLQDSRVRVEAVEPRAFLDKNNENFDIISLATLEAFSAGSAGIGGLREDYVATVEGFSQSLEALSTSGFACTVRGIQDPPRDNIKIPATWIEAFERRGDTDPLSSLLMARDELACATLAAKSAVGLAKVEVFRQICRTHLWEAEWFPGIRPQDTNLIHVIPGLPGSTVSWYHHAIREISSPRREDFYRSWLCNIRPATDDKPFFQDFFRWESISKFRELFGPLWPMRSEMGFLILIIATAFTTITASLLVPVPAFLLRRRGSALPLGFIIWFVFFFGTIGTGFMFLEMNFIQMFTRFLGDPISAAGLVLGGFLFFAGIGSLVQPSVTTKLPGRILFVAGTIALLTVFEAMVLPVLFDFGAGLSGVQKIVAGLTLIGPLAFFMGMPFPWGLSVLRGTGPEAVAVAWSVNGFASVVSSCVAIMIAMVYGFKVLAIMAACFYGVAGISSWTFRHR